MKRRNFLLNSLISVLSLTIPKISVAKVNKNYFKLIAESSKFEFNKEVNQVSNLWLYNQQSPGPIISAEVGTELTIEFQNLLTEPTTIHWHGIRNLNAMDGVANLTQPSIEPGETFVYKFPVNDAGTFWYHAHNKSWEQVSRGLYGPLIVNDSSEIKFDRDIILVADDWRLDKDYKFDDKSLGSLMDWSHQGRLGNWLTINGMSNPKITINQNSNVRLRLINASNARTLSFNFDNYDAKIIALDGAPCKPFKQSLLKIAPAQRVDVFLRVKSRDFKLFETSTNKPHPTAVFRVKKSNKAINKVMNLTSLKTWNKFPNLTEAKTIDIMIETSHASVWR